MGRRPDRGRLADLGSRATAATRRRRCWCGRGRRSPALERALRERGLPVEVVGLGGLLDTPEVRDVVCTLQVLADPTAGASLLRLLTGARWRIGPRDVVALYRRRAADRPTSAAGPPT